MPSKVMIPTDANLIQDEIFELEKRLHEAKARLNKHQPSPPLSPTRKSQLIPIDKGHKLIIHSSCCRNNSFLASIIRFGTSIGFIRL